MNCRWFLLGFHHLARDRGATAGSLGWSFPTPLAEVDVGTFDDRLAVSLRGVFVSMKCQIPAILRSGSGAIVNVASTGGFPRGRRAWGYVAAKYAVVALTRTEVLDYARQGMRVNAVAPGPIRTEQLEWAGHAAREHPADTLPMCRLSLPEEVAAAALWLCSDQAPFIADLTIPTGGCLLAGSNHLAAQHSAATGTRPTSRTETAQ